MRISSWLRFAGVGVVLWPFGLVQAFSPPYRIDTLTFSGPQLAAPAYLRIVGKGIAGQSKTANCDPNRAFADGLAVWNRQAGAKPYSISEMALSFEPSGRGECGGNSITDGKLTVGYTAHNRALTRSFCAACPKGQVVICINDLFQAALAFLNSGETIGGTKCF